MAFLLKDQNKDGSWGSPRWSGGVDVDPVPGSHHSFTTAVTALCMEALLDAGGGSALACPSNLLQCFSDMSAMAVPHCWW